MMSFSVNKYAIHSGRKQNFLYPYCHRNTYYVQNIKSNYLAYIL
uniref:Uncharacterized protein n=1 Tax=Anguilla anguilla TaxID=7936 RepID=A0A0E9UGB6_ANGAN